MHRQQECISGFSQEEISIELNVSEGTVNAIIQEINSSDDMLKLEHEIAVVSKKTGPSIKELASNMAFANAIKKLGFEQNKIDSILKAIDLICRQDGSLTPESFANLINQVFDKILKTPIPLDRLPEEIETNYSELNKLKQEVNQTKKSLTELQNRYKKALAENGLSCRELRKFTRLREDFEEVGLDFEKTEEIQNVLWNIREMAYDARSLIEEIKKIGSLKHKTVELETQCENLLEIYQKIEREIERKWLFLLPAIDVMRSLLQKGVNQVDILNIFNILSKYNFSTRDLAKDLNTYGGIVAAIYKKKGELTYLTMVTQTSDSYGRPAS